MPGTEALHLAVTSTPTANPTTTSLPHANPEVDLYDLTMSPKRFLSIWSRILVSGSIDIFMCTLKYYCVISREVLGVAVPPVGDYPSAAPQGHHPPEVPGECGKVPQAGG